MGNDIHADSPRIPAKNGGLRLLIGVVCTGAGAAIIFNILPIFLGSAAEDFQLTDKATGLLGSIYLSGFGIASVISVLWINKLSWRLAVCISFFAAAFLLFLVSSLNSYQSIAATLFATGCATGSIYSLSFVLAGEFENSQRAVGIKLAGEVLFGSLMLLLLPIYIIPQFGFRGITVVLAIIMMILLSSMLCVPHGTGKIVPEQQRHDKFSSTSIKLTLIGLFIFIIGQSAIWSFAERIGVRSGFSGSDIGIALSVAVLLGAAGSFLAAYVSDRFGKIKPMLLALAMYLLSLLLFSNADSFWIYALAINVFFFTWLFALPFLISIIATVDIHGRFSTLVSACIAFGSMTGPAFAGALVRGTDFTAVYFSCAGVTVIAYIIFVMVSAGTRPERLSD
ncbi:MAG: MFS transporter [Gammaproteobacteria bacterium]